MLYNANEHVCISGVYEVTHSGHRPPHEVWLWADEKFPHCQTCGGGVLFRFVRRAAEPICDHASADEDFAGGASLA